MKKVKTLKKWGIYQLSEKEIKEHGFNFAVIHPNNMGCGLLSASDTDMEMNTIDESINWINNY